MSFNSSTLKVREHRQELNKFMKEIRARDPARRMFLRSDPAPTTTPEN